MLFIPSTRPIRGLDYSLDNPRARNSNGVFRRPAGRAGLFNRLDEVHPIHHFPEHDVPSIKLKKISELERGLQAVKCQEAEEDEE
jgi:hypothetical protein